MSLKPNGRVGFDTIPDQLVNKVTHKRYHVTDDEIGTQTGIYLQYPLRWSVQLVIVHELTAAGETGLGKSTLIESLFQTKFEDPQVEFSLLRNLELTLQ